MIKATKAFLDEIDKKSEALKKSILESKTEIVPVGKAVYVSNEGSDDNDGLSPEKPFATLEGTLKADLKPGDVIFLRRGDMWRSNGFKVESGLTISAYGNGQKPIVTHSPFNGAKPDMWSLLEGTSNVWVLNECIADCGTIEFDCKTYAYKEIPGFKNGKFIVNNSDEEFDVKKHLSCDLAFVQPAAKVLNDNGLPKMTPDNIDKLYLRCDKGNPGEIFESIEFICGRNLFSTAGCTVTYDNLCIKHCGAHGIGSGNNFELTVQNCEIGPLGGAIQCYNINGTVTRFGNGVEIYGGCKDYVVQNCYIHDIYDAGVTHQRKGNAAKINYSAESAYIRPGKEKQSFAMNGVIVMEDVKYIGNLFENCIYSMEYFCEQSDSDEDIMRNILMEGNICRFAGGWGWQRPNKVARHIQGGWLKVKRKYPAENFVVKNNIFDRSIDVLLSISSTKESDLPVMQGNTYIQYKGGNYGMYGVPYDCYYPFDEQTEQSIVKDRQKEADAVFCYVEE